MEASDDDLLSFSHEFKDDEMPRAPQPADAKSDAMKPHYHAFSFSRDVMSMSPPSTREASGLDIPPPEQTNLVAKPVKLPGRESKSFDESSTRKVLADPLAKDLPRGKSGPAIAQLPRPPDAGPACVPASKTGNYNIQEGRPSVAAAQKRAAQLELMSGSFCHAPKRNLEVVEPPSTLQLFEEVERTEVDIWINDSHDVSSPPSASRSGPFKKPNSDTYRRRRRKADEDDAGDSGARALFRSGSLSRGGLSSRSMSTQRGPRASSLCISRPSLSRSSLSGISLSNSRAMGRSGSRSSLSTRPTSLSRSTRRLSTAGRFQFNASIVREPKIELVPRGKNWSLDVLTLFGNAIRTEIKDMYRILKSIGRCLIVLTPDHIRRFYAWFATFRELVSRTFEFHHTVILSKLSAFMPLSNGLDDGHVLEQHRNVLLYMDKVERLQNDFLVRENKNAFVFLVLACHDFSEAALKLCQILEDGLPALIQTVSRGPSLALDTKNYLKKCSKAGLLLPLLTRPMTKEQSAAWLTSTAGGTWRLRWHQWYGNVEKTHFRSVETFEKQALDVETSLPVPG